ncbi:MAG: hypothetical protein U0804_09220 [Gemmataceae bacterium]
MTRPILLLLVAVVTGSAAVGCGPTQAQSPAAPLPPIAAKAPPPAASADAGPMKGLPPRP